jgi:predicted RNA-binding Zn ribbon-like protein
MVDTRAVEALELLQENLSLDFVNTSGTHPGGADNEFLTSYPRLIEWSVYVGVLHHDDAERLLVQAQQHPADAESALHYALAVRKTLFHLLSASAEGGSPQAPDMGAFNHILSQAMTHLRAASTNEGFTWVWATDTSDLEKMLWPVTWAAAELLMSPDRRYLRECAGEDCNWLFLDTSKNHSRRWCSMKDCGNRAKARSHYHRTRQTD